MREGKTGQWEKHPSLRKPTPWCPNKRGRKAPPTGCGGETAPSWRCWAGCPLRPSSVFLLSWVKSPHAGTWRTGPHREVEAPQRPVLTPSHPPPPTLEHLPKAEQRWRESRGQNLRGRSTSWPRLLDHALEERTDRSCVAGPPGPRAY